MRPRTSTWLPRLRCNGTRASASRCTRSPTPSTPWSGGTHEEGFRSALTTLMNKFAREWGILKKDKQPNLFGEDIREGLTAIISVKLPTRSWRARPRRSSGTPMPRFVQTTVNATLSRGSRRTPARASGSQARRWTPRRCAWPPGRRATCTHRKGSSRSGSARQAHRLFRARDPTCELYIVEGDSAGGRPERSRPGERRRSCRSAARS